MRKVKNSLKKKMIELKKTNKGLYNEIRKKIDSNKKNSASHKDRSGSFEQSKGKSQRKKLKVDSNCNFLS